MLVFGAALATFACVGTILYVSRNAGRGVAGAPPEQAPYQARPLVSPAERSFFRVLDRAVGDRVLILVKVRLGDVLAARPGLSRGARAGAWNRIRRKHVDFVLCSRTNLAVLAAVELDDASHEAPARRDRDAVVDRALGAAGIPVHRFAARGAYSVHEVRRVLDLALLKGTGGLIANPGTESVLAPTDPAGRAGEWPALDRRVGRGAEAVRAGDEGAHAEPAGAVPGAAAAFGPDALEAGGTLARQSVVASGPVAVLEELGG